MVFKLDYMLVRLPHMRLGAEEGILPIRQQQLLKVVLLFFVKVVQYLE
jgi:hypothetical protein